MKITTKFSLGDVVRVASAPQPHTGTVIGVCVEVKADRSKAKIGAVGSQFVSYDVTLPVEMRGREGSPNYMEFWRYREDWLERSK